MANVLHKDITEVNLHETKGASTASADTVLVATGSGSSVWAKVDSANIDTSSIKNTNVYSISVLVDSPNAVFTRYIPIPFECTLVACYAVVAVAVTGATLTINVANGASTCSTLQFLTSDSAGTVKSDVAPANTSFSAGSTVIVKNTTSITSSGTLGVTLVFTMV